MPVEPLITRRFLGLWVFAFITFFAAFQLLPAIPFRIIHLGGSKAQAGWFLSVYALASAFSAPLMGNLADHVGRKRMLMTASLLFVVFSLLYGVITIVPLLLVIAIVHGSLWSGLIASASAIMSEFIPESRRNEGLAYWGLASTAAIALAPAAGLIIFERAGWLVLCVELSVLSLLTFGWASQLPVIHQTIGAAHSLRDAWDLQVIRPALSLSVICFGYGGVTSYVAILSRERGIKPESLYFTVFAIAIVVVRVFTSRLGDRLGPKAMLYPSFGAIPIAFGILAIAARPWQIALSASLFGLGMGVAYPAFANFLLMNTDSKRRARTFGSIIMAWDTGIAVGSLGIGAIGQRFGLGMSFAVAAGLSCLAIPIFMAASRQLSGTSVAVPVQHG
ncbi:MAG TPA: MFS transporter [Thermoanaerobaculia bacterium]|nr:MFS transporter [Thermoanaerobaculia bacterium]